MVCQDCLQGSRGVNLAAKDLGSEYRNPVLVRDIVLHKHLARHEVQDLDEGDAMLRTFHGPAGGKCMP